MKIFFSVNGKDQIQELYDNFGSINFLISNVYFKPSFIPIMDKSIKEFLIFDSGAFTIWKTGGQVNLEQYLETCKQIDNILKGRVVFINLDVIPGKFGRRPTDSEISLACKMSLENYQYLKQSGLKFMPVFHQHDNWEYLEKYIEDDCFLLGISPANDISTKGRKPWLNKVFSMVKEKKRCHGLAVTSFELMRDYPWYSVDSASWTIMAGNGSYIRFDGTSIRTNHYTNPSKRMDLVDNYQSKFAYGNRRIENISQYLKAESFLTELWNKRGIIHA